MIRRIAILIVLIINTSLGHSQSGWFFYDWNKFNPDEFKGLPEWVYNFDLHKYKEDIYVGKFYERFALECAIATKEDIKNGNFYSDFDGLKDYLRSVLMTVIKDTSVSNKIRIVLTRDIDLNASMNESGILRLNVGTLATLNNEAELAMLMGHEVGHFINEDMVKDYGRDIERWGNSDWNEFKLYEILFTNYNWNSREDEAAADQYSIKVMKASPYSLKMGAELFKELKRLDIRDEIVYGKALVNFHNTHPDPGDRLKQVKFLANDSLNRNKSDFFVDSVKFNELKDLCYKETVNIGLEQNSLDEILALSFERYLFRPADQENIAVIIECIRRLLIIKERDNLGSRSFILSRYQTLHVTESVNYAFLNSKTPSILNYLTKGFLDIGKDDLPKIKAKDLVDTTVTEFTTYNEALVYFKQKALALNCKKCEMYKFFDGTMDSVNTMQFIKMNDVFATNDLLKANGHPSISGNTMVVVMPADVVKGSRTINRITRPEEIAINKAMVDTLKAFEGIKIVHFDSLSYVDKHQVEALAGDVYEEMKRFHDLDIKEDQSDWLKTSPELYSLFKRNNVKNIYICYSTLYQPLSEKQDDYFNFCKVSIPEKGKMSRRIDKAKHHSKEVEDQEEFISEFASSFREFYRKGR